MPRLWMVLTDEAEGALINEKPLQAAAQSVCLPLLADTVTTQTKALTVV